MYGGHLPPGWSQHTSPTGQPYYFNAATGQSTHVHPAAPTPGPSQPPKKEKPKKKDPIPGAPGWIKVTTNLGNIFYTHPETKRSEWTVPDEIRDAVADMDAGEQRASGEVATQEEDHAARDAAMQENDHAARDASPSDGKRKRDEHPLAEEQTEQASAPTIAGKDGIDAADLIGAPPVAPGDASDDESEPDAKRQKTQDDSDVDDEEAPQDASDDEQEWQRQMAAEMAAEAEAQDAAAPPQPSPPRPSAPPQPPLPPQGGYTGPPPGFAPQPAAAAAPPPQPSPALSLEEGRALFMHMLTGLNGTRDEVNPMAPWDKELPKFVHRSEYTSLGQLKDRQDAFNDWCRDRVREKRQLKSKPAISQPSMASSSASPVSQSPADSYRALLQSEIKSTRARFEDFKKDFKKDRRFYGFGRDDREREKHFKAHLRELGEQKRRAAEEAEQSFLAVLDEILGGRREAQWRETSSSQLKDDVWRNVKRVGGLESRKEYDAVGSSSRRADLFVQWARSEASSNGPAISDDANGVSTPTPDKQADSKARREKALQERQQQADRQRQEIERRNRRALGEANREEGTIRFGELLIDAIRDPLIDWKTASEEILRSDSRFDSPGVSVGQKRQMFEDHVDKLTQKKRSQLHSIFSAHGPGLDASEDIVLPLVKEDAEYERLGLKRFVCGVRDARESTALEEEFKRWKRQRLDAARREFDEMLKENSFVDFWGRLRSEAAKRDTEGDASAEKALKQNESFGDFAGQDEDEAGAGNLIEMAGQIDIEEIRSILRNDQRYRAWKHEPELRDQWIREHLASLGARKQTVFSQAE